MKITTVLFGFSALLLGGIVGAGVALLYAPQSGRATRAMLKTRGIMIQEKVSDNVKMTRAQVQKELSSISNEAQSRVGELGDRIKDAVSTVQLPIHTNNH